MATPHLVQYQGSKRIIAPEILQYFPDKVDRIIEPFAGTCAISILAASMKKAERFWINDINEPLVRLMEACIENPQVLYELYDAVWQGQFMEGENNIDYFYKIRDDFNSGNQTPENLLFLLARVVKGAIRYNNRGQINQSCDKRRYGTKPKTILQNAVNISYLLKGKTTFTSMDYREVLRQAKPGDLVYMDPPYQGTSNQEFTRDNRYIQGVLFDEFVEALKDLNERKVDFIISYDGRTGDKKIGNDLPDSLNLIHLYINAGTSAQSVLNGNKATTYESLYISEGLSKYYQQVGYQMKLELTV